ncbi:hypothetical protein AC578_5747 [Pseudocercospora eumusae]|uniref:Uncharacterized protein n=1 Tax=Pseudocercospora eumusae TaxID=321146 RepID=A0A139H577_9PEZI|nr:hypothetical protein AC578_5747 [Pseudocercospora eumusae]
MRSLEQSSYRPRCSAFPYDCDSVLSTTSDTWTSTSQQKRRQGIAIKPSTNDKSKRAVEKFAFTRVFPADSDPTTAAANKDDGKLCQQISFSLPARRGYS